MTDKPDTPIMRRFRAAFARLQSDRAHCARITRNRNRRRRAR